METKQAIEILVQVAHLAQKGGLLKLQEAVAVAQAINALAPKEKVVSESPAPKAATKELRKE